MDHGNIGFIFISVLFAIGVRLLADGIVNAFSSTSPSAAAR